MTGWRIVTILILAVSLLTWNYFGDGTPNLDQRFAKPSFDHLAGTDHLGRDVLVRALSAIGRSAFIALPAWFIVTVLGLLVGGMGALYEQRLLGRTIDWSIKVAFATPFLIVLACLAALVGRGDATLFIVVILVGWAQPARLARAISTHVMSAPYFLSNVAMGLGNRELFWSVLAPVVARPVVAANGVLIAEIMALDMALTIFGIGTPPPAATLGTLLSDGLRFVTSAPWMVATPIGLLSLVAVGMRTQVVRYAAP